MHQWNVSAHNRDYGHMGRGRCRAHRNGFHRTHSHRLHTRRYRLANSSCIRRGVHVERHVQCRRISHRSRNYTSRAICWTNRRRQDDFVGYAHRYRSTARARNTYTRERAEDGALPYLQETRRATEPKQLIAQAPQYISSYCEYVPSIAASCDRIDCQPLRTVPEGRAAWNAVSTLRAASISERPAITAASEVPLP